jgi:xanthosine utilization system XapX-like protein
MMWSFILAAVGILGIYMAGKNSKWGWLIGLAAQVLWFIFAIVTKQYGFIVTALAYGWVYGTNFYKWHKREKQA